MKSRYAFLAMLLLALASCGASCSSCLHVENPVEPGYPCGTRAHACSLEPLACCWRGEVCGGKPGSGCPAGYCCYVGEYYSATSPSSVPPEVTIPPEAELPRKPQWTR